MYQTILIPLENSPTDDVILDHIRKLAALSKSRIVLMHVADGFVARNQETLNLSESEEMRRDREYLNQRAAELQADGYNVSALLACGEPAAEILKTAENEKSDLIAMATHGHKLLGDLVLGSVAEQIRHRTEIPILMIKAPKA